jgi:ABC-type phosphate transport system ATPase subunit
MVKAGDPAPIRLNFLVIGGSGLGKTTFFKALFRKYSNGADIIGAAISVTENIDKVGEIAMNSVSGAIFISLFESKGFGDSINNEYAIETVKTSILTEHIEWMATTCSLMHEYVSNFGKHSFSFYLFIRAGKEFERWAIPLHILFHQPPPHERDRPTIH